jgi:hypothetical protein
MPDNQTTSDDQTTEPRRSPGQRFFALTLRHGWIAVRQVPFLADTFETIPGRLQVAAHEILQRMDEPDSSLEVDQASLFENFLSLYEYDMPVSLKWTANGCNTVPGTFEKTNHFYLFHYAPSRYDFIYVGAWWTPLETNGPGIASLVTGIPEKIAVWRATWKIPMTEVKDQLIQREVRRTSMGRFREYRNAQIVSSDALTWEKMEVCNDLAESNK